ncbi:MAG TPA: hypothetical protein VJ436_08120 [Anaerolineales bacterium]|nr:hypothetical protein [Anaerolineales bacterium]
MGEEFLKPIGLTRTGQALDMIQTNLDLPFDHRRANKVLLFLSGLSHANQRTAAVL